MGINDNPLGVSGTTLSGLGDQNGALYQFLKQTSGGSSNAQRAIDLAGQLVPQYQEVNPWEVAFQYFAEMGRQASQPGATAFGAAVGSMQVPLDYLNAKKKEKRESDSARLQTALTLGPSLKPDAGKVTYRPATAAELEQYGATKGQMGSDGKFYDLSKTASTSVDNTRMDVILRGVTDDPATPIDERFTSILRSDFDTTKHLPTSALPKIHQHLKTKPA
jgi:hypothetical protein